MRVTTLKASAEKFSVLLNYYAGLAEDQQRPGPGRGPVDYYLDPDEPPGRWWGKGGHPLGLDGSVTGESCVRCSRADTRPPGLGSAGASGRPRLVGSTRRSLRRSRCQCSGALTPDPWVRAEVLAAHDAAVDAALGWFEHHGAVTRRGTDGVFQVDTLGVTAALFRQHTSRTVDPQLHTHAVISAKVQDMTGKWLSLDARFLKYQQRTTGWIYDAALRTELTSRLGVGWTEAANGVRDLACTRADVNAEFSSRTEQVDAKLAELIRRWSDENDGADPDPRTITQLQRTAVVAPRPSKSHGAAGEILHMGWVEQAYAAGFDPALLTADRLAVDQADRLSDVDEDLIDEALFRVSEETSTWLRADLARHLATILEPNTAATGAELVVEIDRLAELAEWRCTPTRTTTSCDGEGALWRSSGHRTRHRAPLHHTTHPQRRTPGLGCGQHPAGGVDW